MLLTGWLASLKTRISQTGNLSRKSRRKKLQAVGAAIESLEDRTLLATYSVNVTDDGVDTTPAGDGVVDFDPTQNNNQVTLRGALQDANALAGTDTILLPSGTITLTIPGNSENAAAAGDLDITDDLVIRGATSGNPSVIDADQIDRVFHIHPGVAVTFHAVQIRGGSELLGGGLYNQGGTVTLRDGTTITANRATGGETRLVQDIDDVTQTSITVANTSGFPITTTPFRIRVNQEEMQVVSVVGNSFNVQRGVGGTVATTHTGGTTVRLQGVTNSQIGGGIYNDGGTINLIDSTVSNNVSGNPAIGTTTLNGSISSAVTLLTVDNASGFPTDRVFEIMLGNERMRVSGVNGNTFTVTRGVSGTIVTPHNNGATVQLIGSAPVQVAGGIYNRGGTLSFTNSSLVNNLTLGDGGGLYNADGGQVSLVREPNQSSRSSVISGNTARGDGGGILNLTGGQVTLANTSVSNNAATGTGNNSGAGDGGGIYNQGGGTVVVQSNSEIDSNSAAGDGGGIYAQSGSVLSFTGDSRVASNSASGDGGGIYNGSGNTLAATSLIVSDNTAGGSGGGIHTQSPIPFDSSTIARNAAQLDGGGIYNIASNLAFINSTLSENSAGNNGGAIYQQGAALTLSSSLIEDSTAGANGGGLYSTGSAQIQIRAASRLGNNSAATNGGGIFNDGGTIQVSDNTTISGNSGQFGGGIHNAGQLTISNSTLLANTANNLGNGGGIYNTETVEITESLLENNTSAFAGGGLYNGNEGSVSIENSVFLTNRAQQGGGLANDSGTVTIGENSLFDANEAVDNTGILGGGGALANSHTVIVADSSFVNNRARFGGAFFNTNPTGNGTLTIVNSTIADNVLDVSGSQGGGGIHNTSRGRLIIRDVSLDGNRAGDRDSFSSSNGGGIFNLGEASISTSTFSDNHAFNGGGVFNGIQGDVSIFSNTFSGNSAHRSSGRGGAIQNLLGSLLVANSTVAFNSASRGGGIDNDSAFAVNAGKVLPSNTIIAANTAVLSDPDVRGRFKSAAANLIGDIGSAVGLINGTNGNIVGNSTTPVDPRLAPLADNGGPTLTHDLFPGSLAIDNGDDQIIAPPTDQRGSVRIFDGDGDGTATMDIGAVEFAREPDGPPNRMSLSMMLDPATGQTDDATPTIFWSTVPGADHYFIEIDEIDAAGNVIRDKVVVAEQITGTSFTPAAELSEGFYRAVGRAVNRVGEGPLSSPLIFGVDVPTPGRPVLRGPIGATIDTTPTFVWNSVPFASRYDLWVRNLTTGEDQVIRQQDIETTSFTPIVSLPAAEYRAWVRAFNSSGEGGPWSHPQDFSVVTAPIMAWPVGPITNASPMITWIEVPGASHYELRVANMTTGQADIIRQQNLTTNSYQVVAQNSPFSALPEGTYEASVRAFTDSGESTDWSRSTQFTISVPMPEAPKLTTPIGRVRGDRPLFRWTAVAHADHYDLRVDGLTTRESQVIRELSLRNNFFASPSHLPQGNYQAWVRAVNSVGETSAWSSPVNFTLDIPTPARLEPISPAGTIRTGRPKFEWKQISGIHHYDLWVDNLTTGQSQVIREPDYRLSTFTPSIALPDGEYRWRVRAVNKVDEAGAWSSPVDFTVDIPRPSRPVMTGPGGRIIDATPTFTWRPVAHVERYDLWVRNLTTGRDQVIREQNVTGTSFTPTSPLTPGRYRVWVRGFNASDEGGPWSHPIDFRVDAPVLSVLNDASSTPTIIWTDVRGTSRYDLWIDNLSTGESQVVRRSDLITTAFTPTDLDQGRYRAWVRVLRIGGIEGAWSSPVDFTIDIPRPSRPVMTGPGGRIIDATPTFTWRPVAHVERYDLWVRNLTTGRDQVIREQNVAGTSFTPTSPLTPGRYRVWVRGFNASDEGGPWSHPIDFRVDAPVLSVLNDASSTPTVIWTDVRGTSRYDLWIDNLSTGESQVVRRSDLIRTRFTPTGLEQGRYRAWVRVLRIGGIEGAWSSPVDFMITDARMPTPLDSEVEPTHEDPEIEAMEMPVPEFHSRKQLLAGEFERPDAALGGSGQEIPRPGELKGNSPVDVPTVPPSDRQVIQHSERLAALGTGNSLHQLASQAETDGLRAADVDAVLAEWDATDWWTIRPAQLPVDENVGLDEREQTTQSTLGHAALALAGPIYLVQKARRRRASGDNQPQE